MAKKIFEDMVKIKRANKLASEGKVAEPVHPKEIIQPKKQPQTFSQIENEIVHQGLEGNDADKPRNLIWFVALGSIIFFLFALSFFFTRAKITVIPLSKDIVLAEDFSAVLDSTTAPLPFDLVVISGEESKNIEAQEKKDVAVPASGTIIIYNDYSSASQTLDINTRLEGSNGKIYKTEKRIVVEGRRGDGSRGFVEVGVYATEPGEAYNSGPLDFKIFGFKGGPKYEKFYGRSKGEMTGGLLGNLPVIGEGDKENTLASLQSTLQTKLLQKAIDQIPPGFILFKDAVFLNIDEETVDQKEGSSTVSIKVRGTLYGFLLEEDKLTKLIAKNSITEYDDSDVYILNIKNLDFKLLDPATPSKDVKSINFNLSGKTKIIYRVDEQKIIVDMLGKKKKDFKQVLLEYSNIESADLSLKPFWRRTVPEKAKHVKVTTIYPE